MRKFDAGIFVAAAPVVFVAAGLAPAETSLKVPPIAAGIVLPDGQTLVVSVPTKGTLIYIDTTADKEIKRVEVDFQPTLLAAQGKNLFVGAKGSGTIHVLEADSGKEVKTIKVPGEALIALACHPVKGLLYSVNSNDEVFAIDAETGEASKTGARGQLLVVDPAEAAFVCTGIQKPIKERLVIRGRTVSLEKANRRAIMAKYKVDGKNLIPEAANDNAAINGNSLAVSGDGKQVAMSGGGGWESKTSATRHYAITFFDTSDLTTQLGQVETGPYPRAVAFHPVLNLGAAYHNGVANEILVFNSKSYITKDTIDAGKEGGMVGGSLLTFGGRGTKLIFATIPFPVPGAAAGKDESEIKFVPLKLTDAEKETLEKSYGK